MFYWCIKYWAAVLTARRERYFFAYAESEREAIKRFCDITGNNIKSIIKIYKAEG